MTSPVIDDESRCACTSGPQFYRRIDIDGRPRCTNCSGLDAPPSGFAARVIDAFAGLGEQRHERPADTWTCVGDCEHADGRCEAVYGRDPARLIAV